MTEQELLTDSLSVDDYIQECVRAENSAWSNAAGTELPEIDMTQIEDEDTRSKVLNLNITMRKISANNLIDLTFLQAVKKLQE